MARARSRYGGILAVGIAANDNRSPRGGLYCFAPGSSIFRCLYPGPPSRAEVGSPRRLSNSSTSQQSTLGPERPPAACCCSATCNPTYSCPASGYSQQPQSTDCQKVL